ncbi:MAG: phosphoribosylanthranilate isomerase [Prevotella sp.]|nr:phosphoribosylanthranilate isomerase [Prevotella sp.]
MTIKVCGMRDSENIRAVEAAGANWMGFIFWPKSSRFVSQCPSYLPTKAKRVGVFVDQNVDEVAQKVSDYALDFVQLHGQESPEYIQNLRNLCSTGNEKPFAVIKAINVCCCADVNTYKAYQGLVDYFLFDTKAEMVGGNGTKFDWSVLEAYDGNTPFLLSGGIGPDDVKRLHTWFSSGCGSAATRCIGIDLNSRFESAPAIKDVNLLQTFIDSLTSYHHS